MAQHKTNVTTCECNRPQCGHTWTPRKACKPAICPECKSDRWDDPIAVLIFSMADWDYNARLRSVPTVHGRLYICVTTAEEVFKYPADSRTVVLITSNWYIQEAGNPIPAALAARGYTVETETEFMRRAK